jgi:hypothetical protein
MKGRVEHQHQCWLFEWFFYAHRELWGCMWAVPNGGKRSKAEAARLKAEGVIAGVFDVTLAVARGGFHGMFIELKAPKTAVSARGRVSDDQKDHQVRMESQGYKCVVCWGWQEARDAITEYLKS